MAEGAGAPIPKPAVPVDYNKQLAEVKTKLMLMKRSMMALRQELRNRAELWEAALDEIEILEGLANEAKIQMNREIDKIKTEKKNGTLKKTDGKPKGTGKNEKQEDDDNDDVNDINDNK
ncbi:unnamed protein product [Caenorhabditis brenneri]